MRSTIMHERRANVRPRDSRLFSPITWQPGHRRSGGKDQLVALAPSGEEGRGEGGVALSTKTGCASIL